MLYRTLHTVLPPALRAVWRPTIEGLDNVPRTGGVLLASNHLSFVDSVVIPSVAPRDVVFLAKSEYFTGTGLRGALQRAWFEGLGMIPVDRDDSRSAIESLGTALDKGRPGVLTAVNSVGNLLGAPNPLEQPGVAAPIRQRAKEWKGGSQWRPRWCS